MDAGRLECEPVTVFTRSADHAYGDIGECVGAVDFRFACTWQVQVRTMDDQDLSHLSCVLARIEDPEIFTYRLDRVQFSADERQIGEVAYNVN